MRLNRNLAVSGVALIIAACSSNTTDGGDDTGSGMGGASGSMGGSTNGGSNNSTAATGSTATTGIVAATGNAGSGNGNAGGNAGSTNSNAGGNANAGTGNQAGASSTGGDCTVKSFRAALTPPAIEFQVDITHSMTDTKVSSTQGQSKWQATQSALVSVLAELPQDWLVGITFFNKPGPKDTGCYSGTQAVDIAPLSANLEALTSAINGINLGTSDTWTPTLNAWQFAFDYLTGLWPARDQYVNSHKYVVFMTDGVPTVNRNGCTTGRACQVACVDQSEYDYFVKTIGDTGIVNGVKTFFIGVPGSETAQGAPYDPRCMLSKLAIAGGTQSANCALTTSSSCDAANPPSQYCHIDLTQASDFTSALSSAIEHTVKATVAPKCDFDIPTADSRTMYVDLNYTKVDYVPSEGTAAQTLMRASSSDCADGAYYYNDPNAPTQVKLCPTMCDTLVASDSGSIQVTFECTLIG